MSTSDQTAVGARKRISSADAFAAKVAAQPTPRQHAVLAAQGLASCAVSTTTAADLLGVSREEAEGYMIGGMTKVSDDLMATLLLALYEYKVANLDTLRGKDQSNALKLIMRLLTKQ